jgi:uncharacterized phage protein (TIGR01671 family)
MNSDEIELGSIKLAQQHGYIFHQFTGLCDRNGREMYEGDIVSMYSGSQRSEVFWDKEFGGWAIWGQMANQAPINRYLLVNQTCEVIGNIHENPELLK